MSAVVRARRGAPAPLRARARNVQDDDDAYSVDTTVLASEVGSVLGRPKDAFLRSVTFFAPNETQLQPKRNGNVDDDLDGRKSPGSLKEEEEEEEYQDGKVDNNEDDANSNDDNSNDDKPPPIASLTIGNKAAKVEGEVMDQQLQPKQTLDWTLEVEDASPPKRRTFGRSSSKISTVVVSSIGGIVSNSLIQPGDYIKSINGRTLGPSYTAVRVQELMQEYYNQEGYLHVQVYNPDGQDSLVQATLMKPRPNMTYQQMGMRVWWWGVLCIKQIDKNSIWSKTVLKETDHIISINDIVCDNLREEGFAHICNELPNEITIVVRRGKQRWFGGFN